MFRFNARTGALALLLPAALWASASGPDAGHTAAPGDDPLACATAGCHTSNRTGGPINAAGGAVKATFSTGTSYAPGTALTITVTVTDPVNKMFGFQMTARLDSNQATGQAGTFTPGTAMFVLCSNNVPRRAGASCPATGPVEFIEHNNPSNTGTWTFTWTPPATNVGTVHFYVAGNAVNGNGIDDGGDHVYTDKFDLTPNVCSVAKPALTSINSGTDFGGYANFAAGSWLELKGTSFSSNTRTWAGGDFNGANAPTSLDGISATVNGKAAFVYYISPTQVNVQAPADTATGTVAIVLTNCNSAGNSMTAQKAALVPGLLAPASFKIGGKQYLVAQFSDNVFVGNPGLIAGVAFRTAKPGDILTIYGIGFGDTSPSIAPGIVVSQLNQLTNTVVFRFDQTQATLQYAGLAPNFVGLYQFNVVVPNVPDGDIQINVTQGGTALAQPPFFLTVKR